MDSSEGIGRAKRLREKEEEPSKEPETKRSRRRRDSDSDDDEQTDKPRWKVHERAEEYIDFASNLMLFPTNKLGSYGFDASKRQYPLETLSALAYLKSPLRRPSVIETWSPYEIAVFEGAIALHGKDFFEIHKHIGTKSTKEVIDFYYVWKKTSHYDAWKESYIPPELDISPEDARKGSSGK